MVKITLTNQQHHLRLNQSRIRTVLRRILRESRIKRGELSLVFVDNRTIRRINRRFLRCDNATDVIAFPLDKRAGELVGEIIISAEEAVKQARRRGGQAHRRTLPPQEELLLYCVHGLLHLVGYDDTTPTKRTRMFRKQETVLKIGHPARLKNMQK